ncbi:MAG: bifunctional metallophosphatase/5'-nucleotidase [Filifactoraceae bacterium]
MRKIVSKLLIGTMLAIGLVTTPALAEKQENLVIIHTNDTHAGVTDDGKVQIGFAKFGTYVSEMRKRADNVLVLDAGDMFQGMPFANLKKGSSILPIANEIGYDAMAIGNHEFDFGAENLKSLESSLNFPMLANNIRKDGVLEFKPYMIKEVAGIKVGVIGVSTPETAFKTDPGNVKDYKFTDIIKETEKSVSELKSEKVDVIIVLTHLGLNEGDYTSDLIAKNIKGIDLIIDGHSHTTLDKGQLVGDTLIVSTGSKLNAVGKVAIQLEEKKVIKKEAKLFKYNDLSFLPEKKEIKNLIEAENLKQKEVLDKVIGKTTVDLVGERSVVRTKESNLGQLATEAIQNLTKADVVMINGGGIRASIPAGDITMGDMLTVFPYGNTIMVKDVKGVDIVGALEHGTSEYPKEKGAFPHISGLTFTLDISKPSGERVSDVKIAGVEVDMNKIYSLATNDFMAAGGDGYNMLKSYPIKAEYNTLMDTLLDYIKEVGIVEGKFETRIIVKGAVEDKKAA